MQLERADVPVMRTLAVPLDRFVDLFFQVGDDVAQLG